jgi:hypothetical protein
MLPIGAIATSHSLQHREVVNRMVSWKQLGRIGLWRSRRPYCFALLGYYSAQIFLLGTEFTKEFAGRFGSSQKQ